MADVNEKKFLIKKINVEGGTGYIDYKSLANLPEIDDRLFENSTNAVQNKVVHAEIKSVETKIADLNKNFTETGTAANAAKLGGQDPSYYATKHYVDSRSPVSHESTETTYGTGSETKYGHVKLSDAVDSESDMSSGIAASPKAVKDVYDIASKGVADAAEAKSTADAAMPYSGGSFTGDIFAAASTDESFAKIHNIIVVDAETNLDNIIVPDGTIIFVKKKK